MRNRFQQPEDYQPAPIDRQERIEEHFRSKVQDDKFEQEQQEDLYDDPRFHDDPYSHFE